MTAQRDLSSDGKNLEAFVDAALSCPAGLESADRAQISAFMRLRRFAWVNRCELQAWQAATARLDDDALRRVLEVVVLAERDFRWVGGSAAAGIWLYRLLCQRRGGGDQREVADWVFRHRGNNSYLPLGTNVYHARSWDEAQAELEARARAKAARRERSERKEAEQRARTAERRGQHRVRAAQHGEESANRNERRKALLRGIADMSHAERIEAFLSWPLPIDAFPPTVLLRDGDDYHEVPRETLVQLRAAVGNRRGAWRTLVQAIDAACAAADG